MTIYEQIQRSVEFIEAQLLQSERAPQVKEAASEAALSTRGFQDYFWKVTGFTFRDYLKKRRLSIASEKLLAGRKQITEIAFEAGYGSHEAFSRAFQREFDVSPQQFDRRHKNCLEKIHLYRECYMGVVIKDLPEMKVICFDGYQPEPEFNAKKDMENWMKSQGIAKSDVRIFGHNIDTEGNQENNPENTGYRFMVCLNGQSIPEGSKVQTLQAGRFAVTGIEGSEDSDGSFIGEGWQRMSEMVKKKGFRVKDQARWFEEELEPEKEGNLRLDLYVELEN